MRSSATSGTTSAICASDLPSWQDLSLPPLSSRDLYVHPPPVSTRRLRSHVPSAPSSFCSYNAVELLNYGSILTCTALRSLIAYDCGVFTDVDGGGGVFNVGGGGGASLCDGGGATAAPVKKLALFWPTPGS